ncbi:MAG: HAMP domain-containing histidine kinase [Treponema sp.]|jgi:two-component system sensor histidine kinase VanS|nr:HAMP domain-containing histidine kinase [Treponema sp.]
MNRSGKKSPVFTKIFAYTMLLLALMCLAALAVFSQQFVSFYRAESRRQLSVVLQPMVRQFEGKSPEEVAEIARTFYDKNQSFQFTVEDGDGEILFSSPGTEETTETRVSLSLNESEELVGVISDGAGETGPSIRNTIHINIGEGTYTVLGSSTGGDPPDYGDLLVKSLLALVIMIGIGLLGALLFARKVTRPLEEELARERIAEENQRLFFSAASHELKTPIAATEALIEGMIANIGDYKNHPKYLRECLKNLEAQNHLVSEILDLVKLSDGKFPDGKSPAPPDLAELCAALVAEYRPLAEQGGIEIKAELPGVRVRADRGLLYRALSNVVANAVQNTQKNGMVRIGAERRGKTIRLSVLNTGAHISEESLDRLFEPLYRPDPARSQSRGRSRGRSGLGLSIVKKSLERMGIPFALENSSQGVIFRMDLELNE